MNNMSDILKLLASKGAVPVWDVITERLIDGKISRTIRLEYVYFKGKIIPSASQIMLWYESKVKDLLIEDLDIEDFEL